jgi:soluble lytic murein transglycosylase-like protein
MGRYRYHILLILFICVLLLFCNPCAASQLRHSINKYKGLEVNHVALERLLPFNELINQYTQYSFFKRNHKVSGDFIRALILAESSANPRAVSSKGAMGLGQIMYATGKQAAVELSKSQYNFPFLNKQKLFHLQEEDLFDPAVNILLTCYLISKYNYKFNGRLELVLSAWNAGEYHRDLNEGRPVKYKETHDLIGKVNGYYVDLLKKRRHLTITHKKR